MDEQAEQQTIVVIDDDAGMRLSCRKILSKAGYPVHVYDNGVAALETLARLKPAMLVVDLKMPGMSGMDVISRVHEIDPLIGIVVITGYATLDTAIETMKSGACDYLPKPFTPDELQLVVNRGFERRRLMLESQRAAMEREILSRRFVTFVSHQLNTPLTAIHQYLDLLMRMENMDPEKKREWIDRCLKRTEELQSIIRDWLTLARVEGGLLARQQVKVDVKLTISQILQTYEGLAASNRVTLESHLPADNYWIRGDPNCLRVLFDNLIVNAIAYNRPCGKVTVAAEATPEEVIVSVADTGIGIPEKYQRLLFSEFFRATEGGKTSGTGLGLAIAKRIVSEMGGDIQVESQVNVGSTFTTRLLAWHNHEAEGKQNGNDTQLKANPDRG